MAERSVFVQPQANKVHLSPTFPQPLKAEKGRPKSAAFKGGNLLPPLLAAFSGSPLGEVGYGEGVPPQRNGRSKKPKTEVEVGGV